MYIALTDEQEMLRETVARLAQTIASTDASDIATGDALDAQWSKIVDLGLPALRSGELSGLDASGVETVVALEELAHHLCAVPALGQAVLAAEMLTAAGAEKELERLNEGAIRLAPVLSEDLTTFAPTESGVAFDAAGATHALVALQSESGRRLVYAPISTGASGLDLTRAVSAVSLDTATATAAGDQISAERWIKVGALAMTAVAADLVGVMAGALEDAVRYAGERTQFGVKIGSFQAIQHMLADSLFRVEGARSCLWHAAWAVDHMPADEALLAARTAKAYAAAAGREVVETAMQTLGGIAITWEHAAHLRLRRTLLDRRLFGDETNQYEAIATMRLADRELG